MTKPQSLNASKLNELKASDKWILDIININNKITKSDIETFLHEQNIKYEVLHEIILENENKTYRVILSTKCPNEAMQILNTIKSKKIKDDYTNTYFTYLINNYDGSISFPDPVPEGEIEYKVDYDKLFFLEYIKAWGSDSIIYTNHEFLTKQRNLVSYFLKQISNNWLNLKSIMSISLPIFLFDTRSLLELWVFQNAYCSEWLEKAGLEKDPWTRIKYTTVFGLSKLHLCVSQQKPFNPILGETFQCKIGNSMCYLEQTSHHPPRSHFYVIGENYKLYGYNEPEASTGANSVFISSKGKLFIQFPDGDEHEILYPPMVMNGTVIGDRTINFQGTLEVIDPNNDWWSKVDINPDERGFFAKMMSKKKSFPDKVKGVITSIKKNCSYEAELQLFTLINQSKFILSNIEGEFSVSIWFDNNIFWEYKEDEFPKLFRQKFILKSDSFYREDMTFLIKDEEDLAGSYKMIMEERQRRDRKLRDKYNNK